MRALRSGIGTYAEFSFSAALTCITAPFTTLCFSCEQLALGDGGCLTCKARISVSDMKQFLTEEQVRTNNLSPICLLGAWWRGSTKIECVVVCSCLIRLLAKACRLDRCAVWQVNSTSEAVIQQLMKSNSNFIRCPKVTCGNVFERMDPGMDGSQELPRCAPDGQPLTGSQARHMQQNRFRCEQCTSNFCANCNALPYHTALTCQEAEAARSAAKCRFCQIQLDRGKKDGSSCGSEECEGRMASACEVKLSCGHRCLGTFGESECAACLECANQADEFCNICWTEELRAAPCLRLRFAAPFPPFPAFFLS